MTASCAACVRDLRDARAAYERGEHTNLVVALASMSDKDALRYLHSWRHA